MIRLLDPTADQPHWDEVPGALQEDGGTTIARNGATAVPGVFYMTDDGHETLVEENALPRMLLQARPTSRQSGYRAV